jgi:hypothetical protein
MTVRGKISSEGSWDYLLVTDRPPLWRSTDQWGLLEDLPAIRDSQLWAKFLAHQSDDAPHLDSWSRGGVKSMDDLVRAVKNLQRAYYMTFGDPYLSALDTFIADMETGKLNHKNPLFLKSVFEAVYARFCSSLNEDRRKSNDLLDTPQKCIALWQSGLEKANTSRDGQEIWQSRSKWLGTRPTTAKPAENDGGSSVPSKKAHGAASSGLQKRGRSICYAHLMGALHVGGSSGCRQRECWYWHADIPSEKGQVLEALKKNENSRPYIKIVGSYGKALKEAVERA